MWELHSGCRKIASAGADGAGESEARFCDVASGESETLLEESRGGGRGGEGIRGGLEVEDGDVAIAAHEDVLVVVMG